MPRISLSAHLLLAIAAVAASPAAAADSVVTAIEAVETAFRVTLSDGTFKQGRELAGAVLVFAVNGKPTRIRIASIEPDPTDKAVLLHDFRIESTGEPLCGPGPDGLRLGFPLAGRTAEDGRFVEAGTGTFELVCTSGAQGKCVRFGYRAWEQRTDGRSMRDYFNACVRLLRADYCGDGHGWTRDGTLVELWDDLGIQKPDNDRGPAFAFEAGWTATGAVCVAHTRIPENIALARLMAYCPRLSNPPVCDEPSARRAGALLFNRSQ